MGKVKIIGHSLFCTCFYAHGKVLQAVPGRGSHPGLFSMGLAIMERVATQIARVERTLRVITML